MGTIEIHAELEQEQRAFEAVCAEIDTNLKLTTCKVRNATILPGGFRYRNPYRGGSFERGGIAAGVYREDGSFVFESGTVRGKGFRVIEVGNRDLHDVVGSPRRKTRSVPAGVYGGYFRGHFGHFLTEGLARLWYYLDKTKLPIYITAAPPGSEDRKNLQRLFARLKTCQFDFDRLVICDEPSQVDELTVPSAALHSSHSVAPSYVEALQRISPLFREKFQQTEQPLFLSRSALVQGNRRLLGAGILDEIMLRQGARVAHFEQLPFEETVRLVRSHKNIVGPIGSAFHTTVFSPERNLFYLADSIAPDKIKSFVEVDLLNRSNVFVFRPRDQIHTRKDKNWQRVLSSSQRGVAAIDFADFVDQLIDVGLFEDRSFEMAEFRPAYCGALEDYRRIALPTWKYFRYPFAARAIAARLNKHVAHMKAH